MLTTKQEMSYNGDPALVANWQGCQSPGSNIFLPNDGDCNCPERTATYEAVLDETGLVPSIVPPTALSSTWLDDVAGNCMVSCIVLRFSRCPSLMGSSFHVMQM